MEFAPSRFGVRDSFPMSARPRAALFGAFTVLHGKLFRLVKTTLNEVRKQIYRSLLCSTPIQFFSG
jgi:hypothetical protein